MVQRKKTKSNKKRPNKKTRTDAIVEVPRGHADQDLEDSYAYQPGTVLKVDFSPEEPLTKGEENHATATGISTTQQPGRLALTVMQTFSRSLACVLLVSLSDELKLPTTVAPGTKVILKLCDRRFSDGLRKEYKALPWTPVIEADFSRFQAIPEDERPQVTVDEQNNSWYGSSGSEDDQVEQGIEKGVGSADEERKASKKHPVSSDKWTHGHREMYLEKKSGKLFDTEIGVYRHLREVQGKKVPLVLGTVRFQGASGKGFGGTDVKGILMEYIDPSFSLREIPERIVDRTHWQEVGKTAVKLVQDIGDLGVINRDVRLDNILVVPVKEGFREDTTNEDEMVFEEARVLKFFKAFMIDFGLARFQAEDETDEEFRKARRHQDEEGAVGFVLEKHLMKAVSKKGSLERTVEEDRPFKFQHSYRLLRPGDYDDEEI